MKTVGSGRPGLGCLDVYEARSGGVGVQVVRESRFITVGRARICR
jgi:hypothetical protein